MRNYLVLGTWNAICDRCGFKYKANQLKSEWTGLKVCPTCWEPRHPADLMRIRSHDRSPPWTRPEQADVFVSTAEPIQVEGNGPFSDIYPENSPDVPIFTEKGN